MAKVLEINPDVLQFYVDHAEIPFEVLQSKCPHIDAFLSGEKQPTFNQLSKVAQKLNVLTGLLLLHTPIDVENKKLEFRTIGSLEMRKVSENLRDTISDMEKKQDFLREMTEEELSFIGSVSVHDDIELIASRLRELMDMPIVWQPLAENGAFKFFRSKINQLGVYVFLDGIVRQNTKRPLDAKEFRGFTLIDRKAPLIFINSTDSEAGKLFTLIHELVHLFLGNAGIVNKIYLDDYSFNPLETFANKVTAEVLVPSNKLLSTSEKSITQLAREFKVSEYVITRRLFDCGKITIDAYQNYTAQLDETFKEIKSTKKASGGNYYNNTKFKIDTSFFYKVKNAIYADKITYTQAFDILGVKHSVFKRLEAEM